MPHKDPKARAAWTKRWKLQGKEIGYNKWLYDRRKARFDDAREFFSMLTFIADGDFGDASFLAQATLAESQRRHDAVGPSPRNGNGPVAETEPETYDLMQALQKIGLTV